MEPAKKILILLIITALPALLFSCAGDNEGTGGLSGENGAAAVIPPDLPEKNFNGYEFKVYQRGPEADEWSEVCIYAEEENGEPINDAVYRRNRIIENRYNITIVPVNASGGIYDGPIKNGFENSVLAGDNAFDIAMSGVYDSSLLARSGYLADLCSVPHIDLERQWWDIPVNETLKITGKLYFGISCMGVNDKDDSFCILFNKKIARDLEVENPYQLVRDNKWTFDKFIELGKRAATDLNGDGAMDHEDRYGFIGLDSASWCLFTASGERMARMGGDGLPYFTMNNERAVQAYGTIYDIMTQDNFMFRDFSRNTGSRHDYIYRLLSENHALFAGAAMTVVQKARAMEEDFGMLPFPKFDSNQEKYYTIVGLWGPTAVTVPVTNTELERTGIITEAMVAESINTVFTAYYDINLVIKGLRDEDSKEMLDIIMAGRNYDVGMLYNWGGIRDIIMESINAGNNSFIAAYEKRENAAVIEMEKTIEEFNRIID